MNEIILDPESLGQTTNNNMTKQSIGETVPELSEQFEVWLRQ